MHLVYINPVLKTKAERKIQYHCSWDEKDRTANKVVVIMTYAQTALEPQKRASDRIQKINNNKKKQNTSETQQRLNEDSLIWSPVLWLVRAWPVVYQVWFSQKANNHIYNFERTYFFFVITCILCVYVHIAEVEIKRSFYQPCTWRK